MAKRKRAKTKPPPKRTQPAETPGYYADGTHIRQKATNAEIIAALQHSRGLVSTAARRLGMSGRAIYKRMEDHEEIRQALHDEREATKDFAEASLMKAIGKGDAWAVCFYLKCQAKDRGYIERQELAVQAQVEVSGTVGIRDELDILEQDPRWARFVRSEAASRNARRLRDGGVDPD